MELRIKLGCNESRFQVGQGFRYGNLRAWQRRGFSPCGMPSCMKEDIPQGKAEPKGSAYQAQFVAYSKITRAKAPAYLKTTFPNHEGTVLNSN